MKKLRYLCAAIIAIGFTACSGHSGKAVYTDIDSLSLDEPAAIISVEEGFNITDRGIIPTGGFPMIVDFSADWCPPCQELAPIFASLKNEYSERIDFVTVDTDTKRDITKFYGIRNIPTLLFLSKDGRVLTRTKGYIPADSIRHIISIHYGI